MKAPAPLTTARALCVSDVPASDRWVLVVALLAFAAAYTQFFGSTIWSGFRLLAGDSGDASLIAVLHEHVFRSLLGRASLLNPSFYFPIRGVLGYTDAFFLNQIFYAPLRLVGVESLLAMQLTFMLLALIGAAFFSALLARFFGVRLWIAIIAAAIFAFANNLYLKSIHPQHFAIYYLPITSYLAFASLFAARTWWSVLACAFFGGLLLGLTFLTGYYMSWFSVFFLILALPVFFLLCRRAVQEFVKANRKRVQLAMAAAAAGFFVGAAGVAVVYLPAISALRGLTEETFLNQAATFRDLINVSDTNLIWGWFLKWSHLIPPRRLQLTEVHLAVTPLLVVTAGVGIYLSFRARGASAYDRLAYTVGAAVFFGFAALYLLTISFRGEWSLFLLVQKIIPGAVGIRVGFRSQVVSGMFVCVALALGAEAFLRRCARNLSPSSVSIGSTIVLALGLLLLTEQANLASLAHFDRTKENALLASVPPPPNQCRAFAYYNDGSRALAAIHVDAMRIAQKYGLPTVNGYSGRAPVGWNLSNVWEPDYLDRVKDWARHKGFVGPLCFYSEPTKTWSVWNLQGSIVPN
jgi:hypothetical protein